MTTTVRNIQKNEYPVPQETLDLCKKLGVLKRVPVGIPKDISFELHNTTSEMANALRRCINSELEVLIMHFDDDSFISDDSFIIIHELRKRINYIPIRQISGLVFSLDVYNNTDTIIPVYSESIKEKKKYKHDTGNETKGNTHDDTMLSETVILTYLRPGKKLVIDNIYLLSGTSYKDNAAFSFPGKVSYKCLDIHVDNTDEKNKDDNMFRSSMEHVTTKYKLGIYRQKYIDPIHIVKMALKNINIKLDNIYKIVKDADENFYSSDMEINYSKDRAVFKIFNETYTIGNLISRYGYMVDNTITNIHCIKLHPSFNYINIEIYHPSPKNIMILAIELIKKELDAIISAF